MRRNNLLLGLLVTCAIVPNIIQASPTGPSIAIKFAIDEPAVGGGSDETSEVEGAAGVLRTQRWNNFMGANGTETLFADDKGQQVNSTASVEWISNNTWSSDGRGTEDTNDADEGNDRKLMLGYLDTNATTPAIVTVTGLDATYTSSGYDVYVYIQGGILERGGDYTIGSKTFEHTVLERFDGTYIKGEEGNYIVFEDLKTASFDLEAQPLDRGNATFRAVINAIEIAARTAVPPGDFNNNGALDAGDLDALATGMMMNDPKFDLDGDRDADLDDRLKWVNELKKTWMGDSDLNGEFNSSDFVKVFVAGKYETGNPATWEEGDWNGDKVFNSTDFVNAFIGGGYEKGRRAATSAVPEPTSLALTICLGGFLAGMVRRRKVKSVV